MRHQNTGCSSCKADACPGLRVLDAQVEQASAELEELRDMKEDVERRERAQAALIDNQAKRLDELETLYKARA